MGLQFLMLGWTLQRVLDLARFLHPMQLWDLQLTLQMQLALGSFLLRCLVLWVPRAVWVRC
jgi:hypothetical protein